MRMQRFVLAVAAALLCAACGTSATDLNYTLRMEVKPAAVPATPVDPALAALGAQVLAMMVPGGSLEIHVITGPRGTRLEVSQPTAGLPAGAVLLQRPDGSIVGIDPASKTYWKSPAVDTAGIQAQTQRSGAFSTLAGERVERVTFRLDLPVGDGAAGSTKRIAIDGEAWVAGRFRKYTATERVAAPGGLGLFQLADLGLSLRQILRSAMFNGQEIEAVVTKVAEERAPASMFEIPAGYTEVTMAGASGS